MLKFLHTDSRRGLHMQFANGWLVSIQCGANNYHEARDKIRPGDEQTVSRNAEIAVWHREGRMVRWANGDTVQGWVGPDRIARVINYISNLPNDPAAWGTGATHVWLSVNGGEEIKP